MPRTVRLGNKDCMHHWVLDRYDVGSCIKCGAVRDFRALLRKQFPVLMFGPGGEASRHRGRGRPRKEVGHGAREG
ncbi:hypothetical protein ES703_87649 [subsurface metagenome]